MVADRAVSGTMQISDSIEPYFRRNGTEKKLEEHVFLTSQYKVGRQAAVKPKPDSIMLQ